MENSIQASIGWKILVSASSNFKSAQNYRYDPKSNPFTISKVSNSYIGYDSSEAKVIVDVVSKEILEKSLEKEFFIDGITVLKNSKLDQIVCLKDLIETEKNFYIITEHFNGKSLEEILNEKSRLDEKTAIDFVKRIAEAFYFFEKEGLKGDDEEKLIIIHRNVKPKNIIFHDAKAKLRGFEFSKLIKKESRLENFVGTKQYMSPQMLSNSPYTFKNDIWSLGITLYRALFGDYPWKGENTKELLQNIETYPLRIPQSLSKDCALLLQEMLKVKEEERLDWEGILKHPTLNK